MRGVLLYMKRRKKHTNGCLLRLLGLFVGTGFVLLCIAFGLYVLSEKPQIYNQDGSKVVKDAKVLEEYLDTKEVTTNQVESVITDKEEVKVVEQDVPPVTAAKSDEQSIDVKENPIEEVAENSDVESSVQKEEESLQFEEVSIYDAYILKLDENILNEMNGALKDGQIDYAAFVNKMFKQLSFADQIRLLNIILSKAQAININEVWNMVKDGVSEEDSIKLQEMVQAHFTLEELDELYAYYESMEIAEGTAESE